jgi:hypothetical protein
MVSRAETPRLGEVVRIRLMNELYITTYQSITIKIDHTIKIY